MLRAVIALGVQTWGTQIPALRRYWAVADAGGYARILYGDGLWDWTHDGWVMLGALACATRHARVGHAVTYAFGAAAHHPAWLAKRAVAVDHLSGGRFDLRLGVGAEAPGVGASWRRQGIEYPPPGIRIDRLDAAVARVRRLWAPGAGEGGDVAGLTPAPLQRPGPPIWIAAMGPRARATAARRADGWEASFVTPTWLSERGEELAELLAAAGRAPGSVRVSVELDVVLADSPPEAAARLAHFRAARGLDVAHSVARAALAGDPATVVEGIARYAAAGATDLTLGFADFPDVGMLTLFAERVLPALTRPHRP
jgi:alkanesulfonate monooxygenase SsuD/methylene tetrahydromethanopterin reductase-like flavin-dependent oxidoreductase (luciferase family)